MAILKSIWTVDSCIGEDTEKEGGRRMRKAMVLLVSGMLLCSYSMSHAFFSTKINSHIAKQVDPATLRAKFNTQPINLKSQSKCKEDVSVSIVNAEKRTEDFVVNQEGSIIKDSIVIDPQELTGQIVSYMEDALKRCRVKIDPKSQKVIYVSFKNLVITKDSTFRKSHLEMDIGIPEKQYIQAFSASQQENGLNASFTRTTASNIHILTWDVIQDPIIQDYILCID